MFGRLLCALGLHDETDGDIVLDGSCPPPLVSGCRRCSRIHVYVPGYHSPGVWLNAEASARARARRDELEKF